MSRAITHLLQLHEMCLEELQLLQSNITTFLQNNAKMLKVASARFQEDIDNNAVALIAYDSIMSSISNIMDLARKFNLHLNINNIEKNSSYKFFEALQTDATESSSCSNAILDNTNSEEQQLILYGNTNGTLDSSSDVEPQNALSSNGLLDNSNGGQSQNSLNSEEKNNYSQRSILPIEENSLHHSRASDDLKICDRVFNYVEKNISDYSCGSIVKASVTYIKDLESLEFYICDNDSKYIDNILEMSYQMDMRQYTGLPPENEIFGLVVENKILRAVRENSVDFPAFSLNQAHTYRALLLEFGEIVSISVKNVMYYLKPEYQAIPSQAILSKLCGIVGTNNTSVECLKQRLCEMEYMKKTFRVDKVIGDQLQLQLMENNPATPVKKLSNNPFLCDELSADGHLNGVVIEDSNHLSEAVPLNVFSPEDMEMLYEEPLCTSNAMIACTGYNPKDESRLCRFYDPNTGGCFKGSNCRKEHSAIHPEGYTKDVLPSTTILDESILLFHYCEGAIINITPTYVGHLDRFYAQINDPKTPVAPHIWTSDEIPKWKCLTKAPHPFELVLAKYEDGLWYRAKVIELNEGTKMVQVFYVDYGNQQTVHLRNLARCDYGTAKLPFQAILCRLADVRDVSDTPKRRQYGVNFLCENILNKAFDVEVHSHHEDLIVNFIGHPFFELPKTLISMGCLSPFKMIVR